MCIRDRPYAFASHFAPDALEQAVEAYRAGFRRSDQLDQPYVIAACNVVAVDDPAEAGSMYEKVLRSRARRMVTAPGPLSESDVDALMAGPAGAQARHMLRYCAVGDGPAVAAYLSSFAERVHADEVMVTNQALGLDARLRALEILSLIHI